MNAPVKVIAAAAFACGLSAFASQPAQAMPLATTGVDVAPLTEQAHAVRMCNRFGRCWWTYAGHFHRGFYGYRRPVYHYGWRHPYRHYGWGRPYYGGHWGWRRHWR
jgi:hypothetical protein